jgi:PAS domain S-box-containing protein
MFNEEQAANWKSEEMFRLLVSGVKDYAITLLDTDGLVRSWNEGAKNIFGFSASSILGKHFAHFYTEADQAAGKPELHLRLTRMAGRLNELGIRVRKDGSQFHASAEITALRDESGKLTGFGHLICDISSQKEAEEKLRKSEETFRLLVSGVENYAIVMLNPEGYIVSWNEGLKTIKGYDAQDCLGKHLSIFYTAKDIEAGLPEQELLKARIAGKSESESEQVRKDGSRFNAHVAITALHDDAGKLIGFGNVTRDISQQKAAESFLKLARDQAQEASRLKSRFLANMSHEIRTPMNGILGLTDILLRTNLDERQRQLLSTLQQVGASLLTVINDILDFSKLEAGKFSLRTETFSIKDLMENVGQLFLADAETANDNLVVRVSPDLPDTVTGDSHRVKQVLINLTSNAIKFTQGGTIRLSAEATSVSEEKIEVEFRVVDNGIGIAQEQLANVFEPFVQADSAASRQYGGTGLGLSISKSLIDLMEGQIGAESSLGSGSTFWCRIPFKPGSAAVKNEIENEASMLKTAPRRAIETEANIDRSSLILVIEDNEVNRMVILMELEELGITARAAANGIEALKALSEQRFDLILMDCHMPQLDGWQTTKAIRELEQGNVHTPIIALTAQALAGDQERCLVAGMDDYLAKPIDFKALELLLERWLPNKLPLIPDRARLAALSSDTQVSSSLDLVARLQNKYGCQRSQNLIRIFLETGETLLRGIGQAICTGDEHSFRRMAHEFAGSCMLLQLEELRRSAQDLERLKPLDQKSAQKTIGEIERAFSKLKEELSIS